MKKTINIKIPDGIKKRSIAEKNEINESTLSRVLKNGATLHQIEMYNLYEYIDYDNLILDDSIVGKIINNYLKGGDANDKRD